MKSEGKSITERGTARVKALREGGHGGLEGQKEPVGRSMAEEGQ